MIGSKLIRPLRVFHHFMGFLLATYPEAAAGCLPGSLLPVVIAW
jgi:hypothetical protein